MAEANRGGRGIGAMAIGTTIVVLIILAGLKVI
jgi:hypothetical protein